ncbi:MAG: hypothetical protein RBU21_05950 [FCB group bacterium]|jgi:hypothetical protein|nr:hypothetical protein [FCB group bacterium]
MNGPVARTITVDDLLANKVAMDTILDSLLELKLLNTVSGGHAAMSGHGVCVFREGKDTMIFIAVAPGIGWAPGPDLTPHTMESRPRPERGCALRVWLNGDWMHRGPWEGAVRRLLQEMIDVRRGYLEEILKARELDVVSQRVALLYEVQEFVNGWSGEPEECDICREHPGLCSRHQQGEEGDRGPGTKKEERGGKRG